MREHHRVDEPDAVGQAPRHLIRKRLEDGDGAEHRTKQRGLGAETYVQPVADHGVAHEAAGERVEREQRGQATKHAPCLRVAQHAERRRAQLRLDSRRQQQGKNRGDQADHRIEKEEEGHGLFAAGERGRQPTGGVEEPGRQRVAREREVAVVRRDGLRERCLLDGRERAEVDARDPQHPRQPGGDQPYGLVRQRKVEPGQRHQRAADRERAPSPESGGHVGRGEAEQRRSRERDAERDTDHRRRESACFQVKPDQDRRESESECPRPAAGEEQGAVHGGAVKLVD